MSTVELNRPRLATARTLAGAAARRERAAGTLGVALLALAAYGVFDHGAIGSPGEPRMQVAAAAVAVLAAAAWLWSRALSFAAPRAAIVGVLLIVAFGVWSAISVTWSVAPDLTWTETNRVLGYALVLSLAIGFGASTRKAIPLAAGGLFALVLAVTAYALGQKLLPGIDVGGLLDLNRTGRIARLQEPLGYWNALALVLAIGAPLALAIAARLDNSRRLRILGVIALQLILVTGAFTYSRGGALALLVALSIAIAFADAPLRALAWLGAAVAAAVPPTVAGLASHSLSANGVALAQREAAGVLLTVVVLAFGVVLYLGAGRLIALEQRVTLTTDARHRLVRRLRVAAGAAAVLALAVVLLTGAVSHFWHSFTATHGIGTSDPNRLFSADSANRWVWWKEALGAFSARPLGGWGAGSFPVVHLLFRHDTLPVNQPHSAPLQWLAETGLIGAALVIAGWALLVRTALRTVIARAGTSERAMSAALLGGAVAYTVHALYDWDWDFPGVTVPVLILLGVLAGSLRPRPHDEAPPPGEPRVTTGLGPGLRLLALAGVSIALCVYALSVVVPTIAAGRASEALVAASTGSLAHAERQARFATRLDPLSDLGLRAEASIALHRGQPRLARAFALEAIDRQPTDPQAWGQLAYLDIQLHAYRAAVLAAQRVLDLDPRGPQSGGLAGGVAQRANLLEAPPGDDATAQPTP